MTPRIPPKNGAIFQPGQVIRLEFPAQGYVNPLNTTIEFDVTLFGYTTSTGQTVRFQNAIASVFQRVRLLYGATPLEDVINYNQIVRMLSEWTSTNQQGTFDQTSISQGIGGCTVGWAGTAISAAGMVNTRQKWIQGVSLSEASGTVGAFGTTASATGYTTVGGKSLGYVPQQANPPSGITGTTYSCTRRYQINLALGLFTQDKLIPTKFMASQLAIELTLEQAANCIYVAASDTVTGSPTYSVANVNLIPEILQFDASYGM